MPRRARADCWRRGFGIGHDHDDYEALREAFLAYYADGLCEHTRLFDGAARVLDELERAGCAGAS